jgi:DNA-directed RNA polymerase specialized sigma24 family protein
MTQIPFDQDVVIYLDYRLQWEMRTLTDAHPVVVLTDICSKSIAWKYNCGSEAGALKNETLTSLATEGNYEGKASLKSYVRRILISKMEGVAGPLVKVPRKSRKDGEKPENSRVYPKYVSLDDDSNEAGAVMELPDPASQKLAEKVLLLMESDRLMKETIAALPELHRAIVDIVIEAEEYLGSRRIAEEAAKRLGRKVTRYQAEVALAQLAVIISASLWML